MLKSRWQFWTILVFLLGLVVAGHGCVATRDPVQPPLSPEAKPHLTMGNPSNAGTEPDNYLLPKPQYVLSYNNSKHIPNWVSWQLNKSWLGTVPRSDDFRFDPALPSGWYQVKSNDYNASGFDRGHMTPSADRTNTRQNNSATFLMTNIVPQAPDLNRGPWEQLESYCRSLVLSGKELYIIAGGYGNRGAVGQGNARVLIPERLWKVVVVLDQPGIGAAGVKATTRVMAVDMPNVQGIKDTNWRTYRVTTRQIEQKTGYQLLSNLPQSIQNAIETKVDREGVAKN